MNKNRKHVFTLVIVVLSMVFLLGSERDGLAKEKRRHPVKGSKAFMAKDFTLKDIEWESYQLYYYEGKQAELIYVEAAWRPPRSRAESKFTGLRKQYSPEYLQIVAVSCEESFDKRYRKERQPSCVLLLYDTRAVSVKYSSHGISTLNKQVYVTEEEIYIWAPVELHSY